MWSMISNNSDRLDEFMIVSDLAQKLGSTVFHLKKEVNGHQRAEGVGDGEIASCREYLADVLAELKGMVDDQGDRHLKFGQEWVIPFSVSQRLAEAWSEAIDENVGKLDLVVARLRDSNYRLHAEDVEFASKAFRVVSDLSTEMYQSRLGLHSIGILEWLR